MSFLLPHSFTVLLLCIPVISPRFSQSRWNFQKYIEGATASKVETERERIQLTQRINKLEVTETRDPIEYVSSHVWGNSLLSIVQCSHMITVANADIAVSCGMLLTNGLCVYILHFLWLVWSQCVVF